MRGREAALSQPQTVAGDQQILRGRGQAQNPAVFGADEAGQRQRFEGPADQARGLLAQEGLGPHRLSGVEGDAPEHFLLRLGNMPFPGPAVQAQSHGLPWIPGQGGQAEKGRVPASEVVAIGGESPAVAFGVEAGFVQHRHDRRRKADADAGIDPRVVASGLLQFDEHLRIGRRHPVELDGSRTVEPDQLPPVRTGKRRHPFERRPPGSLAKPGRLEGFDRVGFIRVAT